MVDAASGAAPFPGGAEAAARQHGTDTPVDPAFQIDVKADDTPAGHEPSLSEISTANLGLLGNRDPMVQAPSTGPKEKPPGFEVDTPVVPKSLFEKAEHHHIGTASGAHTPIESIISSGLSGLVDTRLAAIELQNQELRDSVKSMQQLLQAILSNQDKPPADATAPEDDGASAPEESEPDA